MRRLFLAPLTAAAALGAALLAPAGGARAATTQIQAASQAACPSTATPASQQGYVPVASDAAGNLCTKSTATISGNVTVVQPTGSNLHTVVDAGSAIVGKVGIDQTTPGTTNGVTVAPTSASAAAIAPVVSAAAEGSHVLKASAGNLYSVYVTTGATAGFLMIFNATSAPGDGAVTPIHCLGVGINSSVGISFNGPPESYGAGITAAFSSTGCFTKTASATAFFHGSVQ